MPSLKRIFAAAALAGSTLLAATATQAQQQPTHATPAEAFNNTPTCVSFDNPDRTGVTFPDPALHQYDEVLKEFAEGLKSYSRWDEMAARLKKLGAALNGVCVYSQGEGKPPVGYDGQMGSIDINIHQSTPWGDGLLPPENAQKVLDSLIHFATFNMNSSVAGTRMVPPILTAETAAFLRSVVIANGHAEAVLATVERGLEENRLAELEPILFRNSPMFKDEIALLYNQVVTSGALTDADRQEFKASVMKAMLEDPGRRDNDFQSTATMMQQMARREVNVAELFNLEPEDHLITAQLTARFGPELANMQIDGKPLYQAYKDFWANNPNDPAVPIKAQLEQFQQYVGSVFAQRAAEEAAKNNAPEQAPQPVPQPMPSQ